MACGLARGSGSTVELVKIFQLEVGRFQVEEEPEKCDMANRHAIESNKKA